MHNNSFRAKVTRYDGGTMVVQPYQETGCKRYEHILSTECTQLRRTKREYIVVFRFPRVKGILAAARLLICETSRLAILMCNEHFNHYER